jgi:hypothetical protein
MRISDLSSREEKQGTLPDMHFAPHAHQNYDFWNAEMIPARPVVGLISTKICSPAILVPVIRRSQVLVYLNRTAFQLVIHL